jgi:hypothetical protein
MRAGMNSAITEFISLKEISGSIIIFDLSVVMLLNVVMAYRKIKKGVLATA